MKKILIVEDDKAICLELKSLLVNANYEVLVLEDFNDTVNEILKAKADLVLLDINLPNVNGEIVLNKLRKESNVPVIMLTSKTGESDEVLSMSYGADDYITKPYNPTILLLRINALFKRIENKSDVLFYNDLKVIPKKGIVQTSNEEILLTKNEMIIFSYLILKKGLIVSRDELMTELWDNDEYINDNALTVNISRLRSKLDDIGYKDVIETRKGQGYINNKPNFYEGEILYNSFYEINNTMNEKIKEYEVSLKDFKEFIELWVHEVKLPISALNLMLHNKKETDRKLISQIEKLDSEVEQIVYYVRSENAEEDYLISEINLDSVISNVALKNKDILLESNISFKKEKTNELVLTDSKWLEFIVNQIVSNSIKYKKEKDSVIKIEVINNKETKVLSIYDNGIGIPKSDIGKVFNKTFTGTNGRKTGVSTGMGLYIVKKLCDKLGHGIEIKSVKGEYTIVNIIFDKNDYYNVLK